MSFIDILYILDQYFIWLYIINIQVFYSVENIKKW